MIIKVKTPQQVARIHTQSRKSLRTRPKRRVQRTCVCSLYWFPHRYQFTKCPGDLWDKIALELGFTIKIVNPRKCPF
jgi:hypothetical protein